MKNSRGLILILGILLGFLGERFLFSETPKPAESLTPAEPLTCEPAVCEPVQTFENLKGISAEEIREYLKIQNAEEKLKKADEILGKIMAALVADIGFKLAKEDLSQFNKTVVLEKKQEPELSSTTTTTLQTKKTNEAQKNLARLKFEIRTAQTEEQALKILSSLGDNYIQNIADAGPLSAEQVRELKGQFEGSIQRANNQARRTTLQFNGQLRGQKLLGNAQVEIFDETGKSISRGRSRGDLSKNYTATDTTIFIEVGGDFMELVYFPQMDTWIGRYLESRKGQLVSTGTVSYQRR